LFLLKESNWVLAHPIKIGWINEKRIDNADILQMSHLTSALLNSIDYLSIKTKRQNNFQIAHGLYKRMNSIDPTKFMDDLCVPMVYPLVVEENNLIEKLNDKKIYIGRWWKTRIS